MKVLRRSIGAAAALALLTISLVMAVPASAASGPLLVCGAVLTSSAKLAADVGPCPADGLIIGANGVTLDLNGHRVLGTFNPTPGIASNTAGAAGITFRQTRGSTVMNGEVTHFAMGVRIAGGSANHVTTLNVHDNIGLGDNGDGIAIFGSDRNRIDKNRVVHNGQWSGISLLNAGAAGSRYNQITDNVVLANNVPQFDAQGTPIDKRDDGIAIEGPGATNNQILRNIVDGSGTTGIQIFPDCSSGYKISTGCPNTVANDYNIISGNTVTHNGFGAPVKGGALGDGIMLQAMGPAVVSMPGHNMVTYNTVLDNQRNGITLGGGNGQELSMAAWTTGAENYGCFVSPNPDDPLVDTPNLCGVKNNTVMGNTSSGNGIDGIYVGPRSDNNRILENTTDNNGKDGIGIGLAVRTGPGQVIVVDSNGIPVTVAGSGARNNVLGQNKGTGNKRFDGADENPACGSNRWIQNRFTTVNQPCVH